MNIKKFIKKHGINSSDIIPILSRKYPKFSKVTYCMVTNEEKYGVRLTAASERLLKEIYEPPKEKKQKAKNGGDDYLILKRIVMERGLSAVNEMIGEIQNEQRTDT